MSNINKAILKLAKQNPVFAKALKAELSKEASPANYNRMAKIMMEMFDEGIKAPLEDNKSEVYPVAKKLKAAIDQMSSRPTNQGVHTIARYLHEFLIEAGYEVQVF